MNVYKFAILFTLCSCLAQLPDTSFAIKISSRHVIPVSFFEPELAGIKWLIFSDKWTLSTGRSLAVDTTIV